MTYRATLVPLIRSGYAFANRFVVELDGAAEPLDGATVVACLKDQNKTTELIADVTCSPSASGADFPNGVIVVEFPAVATAPLAALIPDGQPSFDAWLEIAVVFGSLRLPANDVPVVVERGFALGVA